MGARIRAAAIIRTVFLDAPITHAELGVALTQMQLAVSASDLHGSLVGYLCAGGRAGPRHLLDALQLESDDARVGDHAHELLERLYSDSLNQLDDPQLGFQPLLPADDAALDERSDAVVEWCRGFLGGFGLAGGAVDKLSADGNEILRDFGTIAASSLTLDDADDDENENALTEVIEFVRVGSLLLHAELGAVAADSGTVH